MKMLNEKEWKEFPSFGKKGILNISSTNSSIDAVNLQDEVDKFLPYVTRSDMNNGIAKFVSDNNKSEGFDKGNCITVGLDTQTAFWQDHDFVTGQNIQVITGDNLNKNLGQFILPLLKNQMIAKFNWGGNGATLGRMKNLSLMLPINEQGSPDYLYMEKYSKNKRNELISRYKDFVKKQIKDLEYKEIQSLEEKEWKDFEIRNLFTDIQSTKGKTTGELIPGDDLPYIAAAKVNNGFAGMYDKKSHEGWISKGNGIVFVQLGDGAAGLAYYIPMDFVGMNGKTSVGYFEELNKYNGLFLAKSLSINKEKFSHGHSWTGNRLLKTKVMLPINDQGEADYEYMEQYAKNMMLKKYTQYLKFLEKQENKEV